MSRQEPLRFEWKPNKALSPCCLAFWGMLDEFSETRKIPLFPDAYVEIIFTPDKFFYRHGRKWKRLPSVFVVGRLSMTHTLRIAGRCRFVSIRLLGETAAIVLKNFHVGVEGIFGAQGKFETIWNAVRSKLEPGELESLRHELDARLYEQRNLWNPLVPSIRTALEARDQKAADGQLKSGGRISNRQRERRVRDSAGTNARYLRGLARFQVARDLVWRQGGRISLSKIALDSGYADQAHFTREFKRFSGLTPMAFKRLLKEAPTRG